MSATIVQWCPHCRRLVSAELTVEYLRCRLVLDKSVCPDCHLVLWSWTWAEGQTAELSPPDSDKPEQMRLF